MKNFKTCMAFLWKHLALVRWQIVLSALVQAIGAAASLLFVWYSKQVVDIATGELNSSLTAGIAVLLVITLVRIACRVFSNWYRGRVVILTKNRIRSSVFDKALRSEWNGREKFHSADMANRMEEDIRVITDFSCSSAPEAIVTVLQLIAAVIMLFYFSSSLGWILIWIMPVAVVGARLFFNRVRRLTNDIRTIDGRINGHLQENLQHRVVVKTISGVEKVEEKLDNLQNAEKDKTFRRLSYSALSNAFMSAGFSLGFLAAFVWGVVGLKNGSVTYGLMVAFLQMVGQVQRPVVNLAQYVPAFIRTLSSEDRLSEIEELPQEEPCDDILLAGAPGIRVRNLSFAYEGREVPVFEGLNFDFSPGTMTCVTGATGEGKSTLSYMLLALLKPSSGSIELYTAAADSPSAASSADSVAAASAAASPSAAVEPTSVSVEDSSPAAPVVVPVSPATRCNFMYVPQGNSLLSGTIRDNLLLARDDASEEELRETLHLSDADFVFDLPLGLDTPCSEVGRGLSEGQAQRISIARALLRRGGILILDEATSALDAATEETVLSRIHAKFAGTKTIICITHRPAALALCDTHLSMGK